MLTVISKDLCLLRIHLQGRPAITIKLSWLLVDGGTGERAMKEDMDSTSNWIGKDVLCSDKLWDAVLSGTTMHRNCNLKWAVYIIYGPQYIMSYSVYCFNLVLLNPQVLKCSYSQQPRICPGKQLKWILWKHVACSLSHIYIYIYIS